MSACLLLVYGDTAVLLLGFSLPFWVYIPVSSIQERFLSQPIHLTVLSAPCNVLYPDVLSFQESHQLFRINLLVKYFIGINCISAHNPSYLYLLLKEPLFFCRVVGTLTKGVTGVSAPFFKTAPMRKPAAKIHCWIAYKSNDSVVSCSD